MKTMYAAQVVNLHQVQGEALDRLLREVAERAARTQYGCVVLHELERSVRDFWAVPGDLEGSQMVISCWEIQRLESLQERELLLSLSHSRAKEAIAR